MTQTKGRIIVVGACMLDEEKGWGNGDVLRLAPDNMAVEEGLQVIITVFLQILLGKDGIHIGQWFEPATAGFVVDYTDLFRAIIGHDAVKTVDHTANHGPEGIAARGYLVVHLHGFLESQDGERCQPTIDLEQLPDVFDDNLAIDNLYAIERRYAASRILDLEQGLLEGFIHSPLNVYTSLEQVVNVVGQDLMTPLHEFLVDKLGSQVEDVSKDTVVDGVFIIVVGFDDTAHIAIEELYLTALVAVDGRRREHVLFKPLPQALHHGLVLPDRLGRPLYRCLTSQKSLGVDGVSALYHHLQHEA